MHICSLSRVIGKFKKMLAQSSVHSVWEKENFSDSKFGQNLKGPERLRAPLGLSGFYSSVASTPLSAAVMQKVPPWIREEIAYGLQVHKKVIGEHIVLIFDHFAQQLKNSSTKTRKV